MVGEKKLKKAITNFCMREEFRELRTAYREDREGLWEVNDWNLGVPKLSFYYYWLRKNDGNQVAKQKETYDIPNVSIVGTWENEFTL